MELPKFLHKSKLGTGMQQDSPVSQSLKSRVKAISTVYFFTAHKYFLEAT